MSHPRAGQLPEARDLENIEVLTERYFDTPRSIPEGLLPVSFGTSGHRGTSGKLSFNEPHIIAIVLATLEYRASQGTTGPLFIGRDTHALSLLAQDTVLAVLRSKGVLCHVAHDNGATPTPAVSHAIIHHNKNRSTELADGFIITPSHNPPADGGIKYNPPHGGPADTDCTNVIQKRANEILATPCLLPSPARNNSEACVVPYNFIERYVSDLKSVIDIDAIRSKGVNIGVHPLGGAALSYWEAIRDTLGLNISMVDPTIDPTFRMVPFDHDGKIRMDCSSKFAMAELVKLKDSYDVAVGTDPDADRHGIVVPSEGLLNPNHYLAVAIRYLLTHRSDWSSSIAVGKTLVSSALIDRVVNSLGRKVLEVPVGFKWFVPGLSHGTVAFGGEESAGASFLCFNGEPWSTDKDGILLCLLAAEIVAVTGKDPGQHYREIVRELGEPSYTRVDRPASQEDKARLQSLTAETIPLRTLAGDPIVAALTHAPGNGAPIGGIKLVTENGWCAVRPSGTEDICKLYAESFKGESHLAEIVSDGSKLLQAS